jgi:hypothetical protein
MFGFGKSEATTEEILKIINGVKQAENPPKYVTILFYPDGTMVIKKPKTIYFNVLEEHTYMLHPKGGPERGE